MSGNGLLQAMIFGKIAGIKAATEQQGRNQGCSMVKSLTIRTGKSIKNGAFDEKRRFFIPNGLLKKRWT